METNIEYLGKSLQKIYGGSRFVISYSFKVKNPEEGTTNTYIVNCTVRGIEQADIYLDVLDVVLPKTTNENTLSEDKVENLFDEIINK